MIRSFNRFNSDIDDDSQGLRYFHDGQNMIAEYESGSSTVTVQPIAVGPVGRGGSWPVLR